MNCYKCKYRGKVAGSCHSSCRAIKDGYHQLLAAYLVGVGEEIPLMKFDSHGIAKGWCVWPLDFDPIWVKKCGLFEEKDDSTTG